VEIMVKLICKCGFERVYHGEPPKGTKAFTCPECKAKMEEAK
jgi:transcription initiation factor IIE alpha subunit